MLGGLLELRQAAEKSPDRMAAWGKAGIVEIGELSGPAGKVVIVRFPEEPSRELRQRLRSAGLRWNRIALQWEAIADPDAITALIPRQRRLSGSARKASHVRLTPTAKDATGLMAFHPVAVPSMPRRGLHPDIEAGGALSVEVKTRARIPNRAVT